MSTDDLTAALGQEEQPRERRRGRLPGLVTALPFGPVIAGLLGLCIGTFIVWAVLVDEPFGGEPMGVVSAEGARSTEPEGGAAGPAPAAPAAASPVKEAVTVVSAPAASVPPKTVTIIDGTSGQRQEIAVPAGGEAAQQPPVDPKLLETTRHGQVPRIGPDGTRVSAAYARPVSPAAQTSGAARIALVVGGLGIGAHSTETALNQLPGVVTLAFAPYGSDLDKLVGRARADGHEVLLQVPMEPFDFPDDDPGPQTLLTTLAPEQNVDRLHWLMSRFQGYVGLANYMGARFTATEAALAPVMREAARRGLLYLDDGTSPRSLAGQIAGAANLPFAKANVVVDAVPTPLEIDRALAKLETVARENGTAVGLASALPVTLARLTRWMKTAESRGFVLVPITAAAQKAKSS